MQRQVSVTTLGVANPTRFRRLQRDGRGWAPAFENDGIACSQMNGFFLGTGLLPAATFAARVADPDNHAREIAWTPAWPISA